MQAISCLFSFSYISKSNKSRVSYLCRSQHNNNKERQLLSILALPDRCAVAVAQAKMMLQQRRRTVTLLELPLESHFRHPRHQYYHKTEFSDVEPNDCRRRLSHAVDQRSPPSVTLLSSCETEVMITFRSLRNVTMHAQRSPIGTERPHEMRALSRRKYRNTPVERLPNASRITRAP